MSHYIKQLGCKGCEGTGIFKWFTVSGASRQYTCSLCLGTGANDENGLYIVERPYTISTVINTLLYILEDE